MSLFNAVSSLHKAPCHHCVFRFASQRHLILPIILVFACLLSNIDLEVKKMRFITVQSSFFIGQVSWNTR